MAVLLKGLPPLIADAPRVLVLGSFPSVASLAGQCYYGHPRNHFWQIMELAFGEAVPRDWPGRREWVLAHGLAIWDVIGTCWREGSLDQDIRDPVPNDIVTLVRDHSSIERILCNGGTSFDLFRKHVLPGLGAAWRLADKAGVMVPVEGTSLVPVPRLVHALPSTSPIPTKAYRNAVDKLVPWRQALGLA